MSDPEIGVVGYLLNTLDGLDGIADVGKLHKYAILFLWEIHELYTDSPYSPKSRCNLSSEGVSKSSMLPIYTLRVTPECTAKASADGSGPVFLPKLSFSRRLLSVRPWYDDAWKKVTTESARLYAYPACTVCSAIRHRELSCTNPSSSADERCPGTRLCSRCQGHRTHLGRMASMEKTPRSH
jgi:hypothetical protein